MKRIIILLILMMLTSCGSILLNRSLKKAGIYDAESKLRVFENSEKKIVFIGMHHLGRKEFYDDVSNKIDSLQNQDYIIFYEGITDNKDIDSTITINSYRKLRKLMGFLPDRYIDTTTNLINGKIKYKGEYRLINQPDPIDLKIDSLTSIKADVGISKLIAEFEKNYSQINLDSCDLKYDLKDANYNCTGVRKKLFKKFKQDYIADYRDKFLAQSINDSDQKKITVVYGKAHYFGLYRELKKTDSTYRITKF